MCGRTVWYCGKLCRMVNVLIGIGQIRYGIFYLSVNTLLIETILQDVIKSIEKGYRLPAPMDCPEALYQLMLDCWQKQRTHRPSFASVVTTLDNLARQPQTLLTTRNSPDNDSTQMMEVPRGHNVFISTDMWLESIKMSRYSQHFKDANLVTAQQVIFKFYIFVVEVNLIWPDLYVQISRLTAQQLSDMGITLVGHQKKILHQARQLDTII